ncbi:MAG: family 43 glycosylhydrolase, partial [Rariglobus sp.]
MTMSPVSSAIRLLSACAAFAALVFAAGGTCAAAPSEPASAYLMVHFTGESPRGEQIYFSVSEDGLHWSELNNSEPVLVSSLGEKGVRDPALVRSPDGKKVYLLATDLRIANRKGWGAARAQGSTSLVIWESTDLVNWSEPWMADVASAIPEAGCAWAPEAIYDESTGDYFVYWTTIAPRNGVRAGRIYYARTKDFRSFTPPELYIERNGPGGIIDTQIIEVKGQKHRYYRASRDNQITLDGANSLTGPWERIGDIAHLGYTGRQVEGPALFQFNQEQKWALLVDKPGQGGYIPIVITSFSDPRGYKLLPADAYSFGEGEKRHGGVLNITRSELAALRAKWPSHPSPLAWLKNKPAASGVAVSAPAKQASVIQPGERWADNLGKHIQAHGGGITQVGDTWYWFGEDRGNETTTTKPNERYVSCYASRDLIHWEFRNKVAGGPSPEPELKTPYVFERPKVFHNEKTGKFVMYVHLDDPPGYKFARVGVYVSDTVDGDYKFVRSFRPLGKESRDIGQFIDDDGSAYLIFECRPTKGFYIAKLSADYLDVEKSVCFIKSPLEGGS